ncbi:hypothetical protein Ndes2526B_g04075 [Nannochloris sp. 'desiccata']|nr:hypothetical protein KSW81_001135 [Chlorella desiccata (nom. nud.)]KAH7620166.1 hypothetical protein NADE_002796 [Chlorella desiccata (nom. nud.)]
MVDLIMPLLGPTHVPPTIPSPQVPAGNPTAGAAVAAEKYKNDVLKAFDVNAATAADVDEASRYMFHLQCARYNDTNPGSSPQGLSQAPAPQTPADMATLTATVNSH